MKSASQVLREAKELIGTPEKWCKFALQDDGGAFCMIGAHNMALYGTYSSPAELHPLDGPTYRLLSGQCGDRTVADFNNHHSTTHADVMAAFDRAIALAEKDEAPARKPRESDADFCARLMAEVTTPLETRHPASMVEAR